MLYHALYDALVTAGADLGLAHFGARALNSLRLEKRYAIEILGERRPAVLVSQPLYDVPGDRMRHS